MAIKISDLSVGDWVRTKDGNVIVDIISPLEVVVMNDYGNLCACKIEDIEPVPITAEMLERNGFVKYSEREWGCNDDSPCHTFIHIDTPDGTMWFISFPTIFNLAWDHPIYNIHELQHLIRLAGVDKEINL